MSPGRQRRSIDTEQEWKDAQSIRFSIDIIEAAKLELKFFAEVDRHPCLYADISCIHRATERYERCWLPLVADHPDGCSPSGHPLVPPIDCAWISHLHHLNPVQYMKDCIRLFGQTIDAPLVFSAIRGAAVMQTMNLWTSENPSEPYHLNLDEYDNSSKYMRLRTPSHGAGVDDEKPTCAKTKTRDPYVRLFAYNFVKAASRFRNFFYQMSRPFMSDTAFLQAAEMRYKAYLHLAKNNSTKGSTAVASLVPTYDVDLLWHAHMGRPFAYASDTSKVLGHTLDHDVDMIETSSGIKLDKGLLKTCKLWECTYGQQYLKAGVLYWGKPPKAAPQLAPQLADNAKLQRINEQDLQLSFTEMQDHLVPRMLSEVRVAILSVENMKSTYYDLRLNLSLQKNGKTSFSFRGPEQGAYIDAETVCNNLEAACNPLSPASKKSVPGVCKYDDVVWEFRTEVAATEALVVDVQFAKAGDLDLLCSRLARRRYYNHSIVVRWSEVLASPLLSVERGFAISKPDRPNAPLVRIALSCTPTFPGHHLLHSQPENTDSSGIVVADSKLPPRSLNLHGQWLAKSVLDHTGNVVYVTRIRDPADLGGRPAQQGNRVIYVHKGPWTTYKGPQYTTSVPGDLVAKAEQLNGAVDCEDPGHRWCMFDGLAHLTVKVHNERLWESRLEDNSCGSHPASLLSGRKLRYEVRGATEEQEMYFVTLVRYGGRNPLGAATALFNWKFDIMEVLPEENVVMVLLLSSALKLSLSELLPSLKPHRFAHVKMPKYSQWGAHISDPSLRAPVIAAGSTYKSAYKSDEWWCCSEREFSFYEREFEQEDVTKQAVLGRAFSSKLLGSKSVDADTINSLLPKLNRSMTISAANGAANSSAQSLVNTLAAAHVIEPGSRSYTRRNKDASDLEWRRKIEDQLNSMREQINANESKVVQHLADIKEKISAREEQDTDKRYQSISTLTQQNNKLHAQLDNLSRLLSESTEMISSQSDPLPEPTTKSIDVVHPPPVVLRRSSSIHSSPRSFYPSKSLLFK